jgi:hypothetical protein
MKYVASGHRASSWNCWEPDGACGIARKGLQLSKRGLVGEVGIS